MSMLTYGNIRPSALMPSDTSTHIIMHREKHYVHTLTPSVEVHYMAADVGLCISVLACASLQDYL